MSDPAPTDQLARDVVATQLGWLPIAVQRFTSGLDFFVFDVTGHDHNVVVRLGRPAQAEKLSNGLSLARQLRGLGVPLPEILGSGTLAGFPFVIQVRLPGTDLGNVMNSLDQAGLDGIARAVADAQLATMRLGEGKTFGYAASPEAAPMPPGPR